MAEMLRLKKADKTKVRLPVTVLVAIIVISIAVGYVLSQQSVTGGIIAGANCIPESEFNLFLDDFNSLQENYQQCVADLWAVDLSCRHALANAESS